MRAGIHGFHETLDIDVNELQFLWTLVTTGGDGEEAGRQTAYRVVIWTTTTWKAEEPNSENRQVIWDSSKVDDDVQRYVVCKPEYSFVHRPIFLAGPGLGSQWRIVPQQGPALLHGLSQGCQQSTCPLIA